jgi:hypothetical protein
VGRVGANKLERAPVVAGVARGAVRAADGELDVVGVVTGLLAVAEVGHAGADGGARSVGSLLVGVVSVGLVTADDAETSLDAVGALVSEDGGRDGGEEENDGRGETHVDGLVGGGGLVVKVDEEVRKVSESINDC